MNAASGAIPVTPVLAERGGMQLKTTKMVFLVDTREQNPSDFSRIEGWFPDNPTEISYVGGLLGRWVAASPAEVRGSHELVREESMRLVSQLSFGTN